VENWDKIQNIASRNSISSMQKVNGVQTIEYIYT
jgi:hypothetical protein